MPRSLLCAAVVLLGLGGAAFAAGRGNLWLDVPFVRQQKDGCGAASIAMVMQYWERQQGEMPGPNADPDRILRALYSREGHGIYASAMVRYFEQNGYHAFAFSGEWADLGREFAKGRPLIVALKPGRSRELHYVVAAGVDQADGLVLVNDPAQRKLLKEDQSTFAHDWKATGNWTLLAVPAGPSR